MALVQACDIVSFHFSFWIYFNSVTCSLLLSSLKHPWDSPGLDSSTAKASHDWEGVVPIPVLHPLSVGSVFNATDHGDL